MIIWLLECWLQPIDFDLAAKRFFIYIYKTKLQIKPNIMPNNYSNIYFFFIFYNLEGCTYYCFTFKQQTILNYFN